MKNITYDAGIFTRVTDDNQTSREAAKGYGDEGISCIPLDPSVKGQRIRWKDRDFGPEHFADTDNIAVKNGRPSGGRVAVDADTEISRKVWRELYGDTVTGGRTEDSHWWYRVTGYDHAKGIKSETRRFKNPDKKNLYEYRADGSITVVYPSTHPSGARYEWYGDFRESRRNRKVS